METDRDGRRQTDIGLRQMETDGDGLRRTEMDGDGRVWTKMDGYRQRWTEMAFWLTKVMRMNIV